MNNLYSWGMSQYLPYGGFERLKNVDNFDPDGLRALHNDYPLAPEKLVIPYNMLSGYCKEIADEYGVKVGDVKKLIRNVGD